MGLEWFDIEKMQEHTPQVGEVFHATNYFEWYWEHCGFGQLSFHYDEKLNKIIIDNECMGKESTRKILHAFVDKIVDDGYPRDWVESWGEDKKLEKP